MTETRIRLELPIEAAEKLLAATDDPLLQEYLDDVKLVAIEPVSNPEPQITPVIFRYWLGDVIALFPSIPSDYQGKYCESFQHVGQHGGADCNGIIQRSRPATPEEYAALKRELESYPYYYKLRVYKRQTSKMRADYLAELRREAEQNVYDAQSAYN